VVVEMVDLNLDLDLEVMVLTTLVVVVVVATVLEDLVEEAVRVLLLSDIQLDFPTNILYNTVEYIINIWLPVGTYITFILI
jgi:hypothetical protein